MARRPRPRGSLTASLGAIRGAEAEARQSCRRWSCRRAAAQLLLHPRSCPASRPSVPSLQAQAHGAGRPGSGGHQQGGVQHPHPAAGGAAGGRRCVLRRWRHAAVDPRARGGRGAERRAAGGVGQRGAAAGADGAGSPHPLHQQARGGRTGGVACSWPTGSTPFLPAYGLPCFRWVMHVSL